MSTSVQYTIDIIQRELSDEHGFEKNKDISIKPSIAFFPKQYMLLYHQQNHLVWSESIKTQTRIIVCPHSHTTQLLLTMPTSTYHRETARLRIGSLVSWELEFSHNSLGCLATALFENVLQVKSCGWQVRLSICKYACKGDRIVHRQSSYWWLLCLGTLWMHGD